ncbi:hypothetical protein [Aquabacterium sp. CECT 9606]|uniref:hypothetical protein n=1 Tax=Aquabacterium sp. CECT 9606 TaxID=2845822 RepID=UPI001E4FB5A4|nr:hypothetical protein [Aquabacterium sp. CECT 9606]CAH0351566.1 hypothetical protein AQB9606_02228 [Aquabacterium sp. CECT 9606]
MTRFQLFARAMQLACVVCGLLQLVIDRSHDNGLSVLLIVASTLLIYQYLDRSRATVDYPVSSLAIIGFNVTSSLASLVAQTTSWVPVSQLLRAPVLTFSVLAAVSIIAVLVHWIYRHLAATVSLRDGLAMHVFRPLGVLDAPPIATLWAMAMLGALSTLQGGAAFGDAGGKFFQALSFLQWLPFAIPLYYKKYGHRYCDIKKQIPLLIAFTIVLMGIGLLRNARQLMLIGPVQAALVYFIWAMQDPSAVRKSTFVKAGAGLVAVLLGITLFTDVAVAMALARDKRETLTPWQMAQETYQLLGERDKLAEYRMNGTLDASLKTYDEAYLSNPLLARFSETKFHDNMLNFAFSFNAKQRGEVLDTNVDKLLMTLPQPVLDMLEIKLDKQRNAYSMGDFYRYQNEGSQPLGGFATGSMWADVIVIGQDFSPFLVAILFLLLFLCFDSLSLRGEIFMVSPIMLGGTWGILLYGLGSESLASKLAFLLRDMPQKVLIYAALAFMLNMVFKRTPGGPLSRS